MTYNTILMYLKSGYKFGQPFGNVRFPFFNTKLVADDKYIHWKHFGSSANELTKRDLQWIIENIFHTDADGFVKTYKPLIKEYEFKDDDYTTIFELYNLSDSTIEYYVGKKNKEIEFSFGVLETDRFDSEHIVNLYNNGWFD